MPPSWGCILVWPLRASVRACVCSFRFPYGQERLEIGSWNFICGISMKRKRARIFFSFPSNLWPFFDFPIVSLWNLVNKISREPLERGSWYLAHRLCSRCKWPEYLLAKFCKYLTKLSPFPTLAFCIVKQNCEQNYWRTSWARIVISGIPFGYMM